LFDNENVSTPAVLANKLTRPSEQPTPQKKVPSLLVEPCIAAPTFLPGLKPASSSPENGFSPQKKLPAAASPAACESMLAEPQDVQKRQHRASTRASQRQPKTTTAASLAEDGQRQEGPTD